MKNYRGRHLMLDHAWLFDRPAQKPAVIVAAGGPEAAKIAAHKADGLIATEARADLLQAYVAAGGKGPRYCEISLCYAARARRTPARPRTAISAGRSPVGRWWLNCPIPKDLPPRAKRCSRMMWPRR